ncbi:MAG: serine/threonine-protein kinase [Polyangia bacterium]
MTAPKRSPADPRRRRLRREPRPATSHRDLKPDNVMVVRDPEVPGGERAIILDFGVAKLAEEHKHPETLGRQTDLHVTIGTARYMSPEQAALAPITDRTDVYALGVVLYELLSGAPPFAAANYPLLLDMHRFSLPIPLERTVSNLPEPLTGLVHRMLAKDPTSRPAMAEVAAELERVVARLATASASTATAATAAGPASGGVGAGAERAARAEAPEPTGVESAGRTDPLGDGADHTAPCLTGPSEPPVDSESDVTTSLLPGSPDSVQTSVLHVVEGEQTAPMPSAPSIALDGSNDTTQRQASKPVLYVPPPRGATLFLGGLVAATVVALLLAIGFLL